MRLGRLLVALFSLTLVACGVPVATGLDDGEANRVFVALDQAGVDANKEPDPIAEGKWKVSVSRDDAARALSVLREEELPRPSPQGVLEAIGKESLVPSEAAEHAQLVAGLAGDLERSFAGIDGILNARVHLNVPAPNPLRDTAPPRGTAGVLIEHRGATPPISSDSVQRLVASGVAGLLPTDVVVVMLPRAAPPDLGGTSLAHVGPIAVARASVQKLQAALAALIALVAILAGATLVLYSRLTHARADSAR